VSCEYWYICLLPSVIAMSCVEACIQQVMHVYNKSCKLAQPPPLPPRALLTLPCHHQNFSDGTVLII